MIFSGFGIFLGVITPFLFIGEFFYFIKMNNSNKKLFAIFSVIIILFSFYLFSIGYVFRPAVGNFVFPHPKLFEYVEFIALAYANFLGRSGSSNLSYFLGYSILLISLIILFKNIIFVFENKFDTDKNRVTISKIIIILIGYSLVFILNSAVGRVSVKCQGTCHTLYHLF